MLFGNLLGPKVRPRSFIYTPRYYDPDKDLDRRERMKFTPPMRAKAQTQSPWVLLAVTLVIAALILSLKYGFLDRWDPSEVTLTTSDAAPVDTTGGSFDAPR